MAPGICQYSYRVLQKRFRHAFAGFSSSSIPMPPFSRYLRPRFKHQLLCHVVALTVLTAMSLKTIQLQYHSGLFLQSTSTQFDPHYKLFAQTAVEDFFASGDTVFPDTSAFTDDFENSRLLIDSIRLPPVFVSRLGAENRRQLIRRLTVNCNGKASYDCNPKIMVLDVQNGLGNRLRALASALEFVFNSRRLLVLVWTPDAHINVTFSQLFDPVVVRNLIVINSTIEWPVNPNDIDGALANHTVFRISDAHVSHQSMTYISLMEKDISFSRSISHNLNNIPSKNHVYIRTAYLLQSYRNGGPYRLVNTFLQALTPSPVVRKLVHRVEQHVGGENAIRQMIGVHIRSRSMRNDNAAVDYHCEYSIAGAARTDRYRSLSTPRHFIPEMISMRRKWPSIVDNSYTLVRRRNLEPVSKFIYLTNNQTANWSIINFINHAIENTRTVIWEAQDNTMGNSANRILVDLNISPRFYVATDSVTSIEALRANFKSDDLVVLPRNCDDRSADCIFYAFADMIVLSRTAAMIQSGWSSFSEVAGRLRARPVSLDPNKNEGYTVRISGFDFGQASTWTRLCDFIQRSLRDFMRPLANDGNATAQVRRIQICENRRQKMIP